ncbi:NAD(P)-binding protein [Wilcoxina mikolae CBS 423.85]|nr:NAD(P)-binding protein [Wilcoxina mikolae CBS 423.85]
MSEIKDFSTLFSLTGKTAVVTGGSRGLGLHAATGLLHAGVKTLIITSRKADACSAAVSSLQTLFPTRTITSIPADLSIPSEVTRFVTAVSSQVPHVHILIANAGATWGAPFDSHPDSAFSKVFDLNVRSVFNLIRDMTPLLSAAGSMEDPARVITVGSIAGIQIGNIGDNGTYGYSASKAAVHHLTKHLAVELGPRGILVNAIAPGFFITKMAKGLVELIGGEKAMAERSPDKRLGRNEDIAGVVVWLCSRAAAHCNGIVVPIDGGAHLVARL